MKWRSAFGLIAILAAMVAWSIHHRNEFHANVYVICLGLASDRLFVTPREMLECGCVASEMVAALPWKSRLPLTMIRLDAVDNARMVEARLACAFMN